MSTPNERVEAVEAWSKLKPADFARKTGILPGTLSKAKKGPFSPSAATMNKIIISFPQISSQWLLQGKGEMLITKPDVVTSPMMEVPGESEEIKYLRKENESLREQLASALEQLKEMTQQLSFVRQLVSSGGSFTTGNSSSAEPAEAVVRSMYVEQRAA